jgi:tRNA pseudouridine-54 N-methylase
VLDERGADVRDASLEDDDVTLVLGDHLGLDEAARASLGEALSVSLGPTSVLAEDAIALMHNELDRRAVVARRS